MPFKWRCDYEVDFREVSRPALDDVRRQANKTNSAERITDLETILLHKQLQGTVFPLIR